MSRFRETSESLHCGMIAFLHFCYQILINLTYQKKQINRKMPEIGIQKSVFESLRPSRVNFCYFQPLLKEQLQVLDYQTIDSPDGKEVNQSQFFQKDPRIEFQRLKDKTNCETSYNSDQSLIFLRYLTKIKRHYLDDFQFLNSLGKGAYGRVEKLKSKENNCVYAAKTILKSSSHQVNNYKNKKLEGEIKLYEKLFHTNIPQLFEIYSWKNQNTLIMEYVEGSNLHSLVNDYPNQQKKIARIIYQILDVLEYLHSLNIVHHDIKPQNIIFDPQSEIVKIVDFGEAIQMNSSTQMILNQGGTYAFFAPEHFQNVCSGKIDIWACGVILNYLLDGVVYFSDQTREGMRKKIQQKPILFKGFNWNNRSEQVKDLISRMLDKDYKKRISAADAKRHPWIVENCKEWRNPSKNMIRTMIRHARRSFLVDKQVQKLKARKLSNLQPSVKRHQIQRKQNRLYSNPLNF